MVRFKKRYFVVQLDRPGDIFAPTSTTKSKKRKLDGDGDGKQYGGRLKPRVHRDPRPLDVPDGVLSEAVKDVVQKIHGDFGRAAITTGLRTIYCNPETHVAMIQVRHGPHRLVSSSLPFLNQIRDEKVIPKLIYTGATIRHCFKVGGNRVYKSQCPKLFPNFRELKSIRGASWRSRSRSWRPSAKTVMKSNKISNRN